MGGAAEMRRGVADWCWQRQCVTQNLGVQPLFIHFNGRRLCWNHPNIQECLVKGVRRMNCFFSHDSRVVLVGCERSRLTHSTVKPPGQALFVLLLLFVPKLQVYHRVGKQTNPDMVPVYSTKNINLHRAHIG